MIAPTTIAKSVLIVDDDDDFRVLVTRLLRKAGYHTVIATSGEEALEKLRAGYTPNLIVLDVKMPGGMGGPRFYDDLRRERGFERVPIVVMTALEPRHMFGWVVCADKGEPEELLAAVAKYTS